jgi:hemerythrin
MDKKQTALDWYFDKIKSHFEHDGDLLETATFTFAIAKQKEKEQIVDAVDGFPLENRHLDGEQYYNETYGN